MLLTLNIDWLTKVISVSASTIVQMGKCADLFGNRFPFTDETDPKIKEELEKTPVDKINLKYFLKDVRVNIQLVDDPDRSGSGSGQSSGRSSGRKGKPTIAEVKARFLAAQAAGKIVSPTDLWLLNDEQADGESTRVIDDDGDLD
jgi:hypothetical protein